MKTYTVKQGDTIWGIAKSLGIPTKDLMEWNNIAYANDLQIGQTLKLSANAAPITEPLPTMGAYDTTSYDDTKKGQTAGGAYNTAKENLNKYGDFTYANQKQYADIMDKINNREKFSYDLNGDALYQQYKDKYIKQGKMAMGDAIGQASAMTGGYGNSYAQSVGQQAYQAQLENLNDIVPELWQMAYDKYNQEGQDLYNLYGMLSDDYDRQYGTWNDKYGRLMDALGIARSDYYDGADMFYTEQNNKNDVTSKEFAAAMDIWNANNTNDWKEKEYDAMYGNTAKDENTKSYSGTTASGKNYNNGSLTDAQVKELQAALGVEVDGYYGEESKAKADNLSANEAYEKYVGNDDDVEDDEDLTPYVDPPHQESAQDYADWEYGDWEGYFATIRNTEGKSAAETELSRMNKAGFIPKEFIVAASIGARGSLGH